MPVMALSVFAKGFKYLLSLSAIIIFFYSEEFQILWNNPITSIIKVKGIIFKI